MKNNSKGRFNLRYLTKEGFRNVRTHKLMSVASITVMLSCLLLIGGAYLIYTNIEAVIEKVGEQNVIMVFVQDTADKRQEDALEKQIKDIANVKDCTFVSREDTFQKVLLDMGQSADIVSGMGSDFLPDAFKVTIRDMAQFQTTVKRIQSFENVLIVRENGELANKLNSIQKSVSLMALAIAVILLAVSLFIIANTVRITMYSRSLEISIMKAVGATNGFIRWPFIIEGIVIGFISAVCGLGLVSGVYLLAQKAFSSLFEILGGTAVPLTDMLPVLAIAFAAIGILTGCLGSLISMNRYLKDHGKVVDN